MDRRNQKSDVITTTYASKKTTTKVGQGHFFEDHKTGKVTVALLLPNRYTHRKGFVGWVATIKIGEQYDAESI